MKRLAILPARGGSKRIKYKNIKAFHGEPLISYSLDATKKSGLFDKIHVSTDDQAIYETCASLGNEPDFLRSADIADDVTPIFEVLKNVIDEYRKKEQCFDTVCLVYPTAPLLKSEFLQKACAQFEGSSKDKILMSVAEFPCPIEWAYRKSGVGDNLSPAYPGGFAMRSQDLETAYYDAAMFAFFTPNFIDTHNLSELDQHCTGFVVPNEYVTDIDTPEDWEHAAKMYKALRGAHES